MTNPQPKPNDTDPRWSDFDPFLTAEDLDGKPQTWRVTKTSVVEVYDQKTKKTASKPVIHFAGTPKYMILSPTNRHRLQAAFGNRCANAVGKLVTVKTERVKAFGVERDVLRISIPAQVDKQTGEISEGDNEPPSAPAQPTAAAPTAQPTPAAKPGTTSPKTNGKPRDPETVRQALKTFAAATPGPAGAGLIQQASRALAALVNGNDQKRHQLTTWLFGKASSKDLTTGECLACLQWIGLYKEGEQYIPVAMAIEEGNAILALAGKETTGTAGH